MKRNKKRNTNGNGLADQAVRLEFIHSAAKSVSIAGTFNDWRPGATEMVSLGDGRWLKELVLAPGVYEYRLVVDGEWMPDPRASETAPNPFGGMNSVLKVNECATFTAR
jgi:1,4-alpha-glucan branching enzyme